MKTILVFVQTLDGKITKGNDPHVFRWTSKEDQEYFKNIWKTSKLLVMGSGTFDHDPIKPTPENHLLIMTSRPEHYKAREVKGQLEFTSESPRELSDRFAKAGYDQITVVGGAHIAASFLAEGLVDEIWLTIEPRIFGEGINFVTGKAIDVPLQLLKFEKVNEEGTLILKYAVKKS
jgi:dihydrofolate reductase